LGNLTPCPPLLEKERGRNKKEGGFAPLLKLLPPSPQEKGVNVVEKRKLN